MDNKFVPLKERIKTEMQYHNHVSYGEGKDLIYSLPIPPIIEKHIDDLFGNLSGKTVIEIGCGQGENLLKLASKGACVWGIDVSQNAIERSIKLVKASPFSSTINVLVGDAHKIPFPDSFADIIFGNAILHHLELKNAHQEIYRLLKREGRGIFIEPLGHNFFINLFRKLTPKRRTDTERPLKMSDLDLFENKFRISHKEFFCLSLIAFLPGILGLNYIFKLIFNLTHLLERKLYIDKLFKKYCWITVLELHKKN